jgi:hypothetical protein
MARTKAISSTMLLPSTCRRKSKRKKQAWAFKKVESAWLAVRKYRTTTMRAQQPVQHKENNNCGEATAAKFPGADGSNKGAQPIGHNKKFRTEDNG